jgi:hypothetical protein
VLKKISWLPLLWVVLWRLWLLFLIFQITLWLQICPDISDDNYNTMLQTLVEFYRKRTMTAREVFHIVHIYS